MTAWDNVWVSVMHIFLSYTLQDCCSIYGTVLRSRHTNHVSWIVSHIKHFLFTGCWGRIKILLQRLLDLCCTSSGLRSCQARTMVSLRLSLKTKMPDEAVTNQIPSLLLPHFFLTLHFLPFIFVLFLESPSFVCFPSFLLSVEGSSWLL